MKRKNPFQIVKVRHITEKSMILQELKNSESNLSVKRCEKPKYVFIVDKKATKLEIKEALEEIYKEKGIQVKKVNTITNKPKRKRVRGIPGVKSGFKKAVVTLDKGDSIENV
jgi:large subunit ribosomal protein L23